MAIAIFGGSFDPVHEEHVAYVKAVKERLGLERVYVIPSYLAPHKQRGSFASADDRLTMCKIAFRGLSYVTVDDCEIKASGTSYTYLTCRLFRERFSDEKIYLLVGADMLEDFFHWRNPDDILTNVTLAACGRGSKNTGDLQARFASRFSTSFVAVPFTGAEVSSTKLRVDIAFGKQPYSLDSAVYTYITEKGLYAYPVIAQALALEKEARREHSYRVAIMAAARARSLSLSEEKALLASALHDCGKYVPLSSPLLQGFTLEEEVPEPVLHQYTGAYLAEHIFGITDGEILDAIRYHTSGKEDMSLLGKLIFLADMLEEGRAFPGVDMLRKAFYEDLDGCFLQALSHQISYLEKEGKEIYPLTKDAYLWAKRAINSQ